MESDWSEDEHSAAQGAPAAGVLFNLFSYSVSVCAVLLTLTGVPTCHRFVRDGHVGEKRPGPFVVGALSCAVWVKHGVVIHNAVLIFNNCCSMTLNVAYTCCYVFYAKVHVKKAVLRVAAAMLVLYVVFLVTAWELRQSGGNGSESRLTGLTAAALSVCFSASSLDAVVVVLKKNNTNSLQKPLIVMNFVVSIQLVVYGRLISDDYLVYSNALSTVISALLLSLFCLFPKKVAGGAGKNAKKINNVEPGQTA